MSPQLVIEILASTDLGGAEIAVAERLQVLSDLGQLPDTMVVDLGVRPGVLAADIERFARCVQVPRRGLVLWLRNLILTVRPNVVICHSPRGAIAVLLATRWLTPVVPYVVVAHNTKISDRRLKVALLTGPLWWANRYANKVVGVSSAVLRGPWARGARQTQVAILGSQLKDSGDVAPSGVWPPDTRIKLLALSRFVPKKNYAMLLTALHRIHSELRESGAVCALVGYGPSETALREQTRLLGLEDVIVFHPATRSPGALMAQADIFLIPSVAEGGPLTLYEALLAGTRVVSTNVGAVDDILGNSDHAGIIVLGGFSESELSDAVVRLIRQGPVGRSERSTRAQKFAYLHISQSAPVVQSLLTGVHRPPVS